MRLPARTELRVDIADKRFPHPGVGIFTGPIGMELDEFRQAIADAYLPVLEQHGLTIDEVTPDLPMWRVLVSFREAV